MDNFERNTATFAVGPKRCPWSTVPEIAIPLGPEQPGPGERVCDVRIVHHPAAKQHDRTRSMLRQLFWPDPECSIAVHQRSDAFLLQLPALPLRDEDREVRPASDGLGNAVDTGRLQNLRRVSVHD